ncbi:MAG: glutamate--tRNA ligase family protein [Phycisphaerales bacterium]|jgi:glutamyl-tRNA synthetase|nr:glutamate--tRNA ligase family protein [Phycisphaerales bacterium]
MRTPTRTRLAPSPTGALHLGNARTFILNWALARSRHWSIILRVEDLDSPRVKPGAIQQAIDDLTWLGMDWDDGPVIQSDDPAPYAEAMRALAAHGLAYPAPMSRREILSRSALRADNSEHVGRSASDADAHEGDSPASAPNEGSHEARYPPELRPPGAGEPREFDPLGPEAVQTWRLLIRGQDICFNDRCCGPQSINPAHTVGDFIVWTARGVPAYQLAVVVDDARQGIDAIVRGRDLLDSAARQILLRQMLGLASEPAQWHLPLVRGPDGRRLAKRHGDTRLAHYRERGVRAERVLGLLAGWCGLCPSRSAEMDAPEFLARFGAANPDRAGGEPESGGDPPSVPSGDIVLTPEDDRWLLE